MIMNDPYTTRVDYQQRVAKAEKNARMLGDRQPAKRRNVFDMLLKLNR